MTDPLTDAAALAIYDTVWPNERDGRYPKTVADAVRQIVALSDLDTAVFVALRLGYDSADPHYLRSRIRELRRLAGIDDDADLVERMAQAIRDTCSDRSGTTWDTCPEHARAYWRCAARSALAVVRSEEGL